MMEATGRLHELAWRMADAEGLSAAVARVRHFARARGTLAKTDKIDALVIAVYGAMIKPAPICLSRPIFSFPPARGKVGMGGKLIVDRSAHNRNKIKGFQLKEYNAQLFIPALIGSKS